LIGGEFENRSNLYKQLKHFYSAMFGNETHLPENFPRKAQMEYEKEIA